MVNKLTNAVINNLKTSNKTVVGALNELNSNTFRAFNLVPYDAISDDLKAFNYGIARYSYTAKGAPSNDNGYLISIYRSEVNRIQIALSDAGSIYVRTTNSTESFQSWITYNKIQNSNAQNISFKGNIKSVSFRSGGTGLKNIYIDFYQADNSRSTLAFLSDGENAIGFYEGDTNIWKLTVK